MDNIGLFTGLMLRFIIMSFCCILSNPTFVLHFLAHKWRIIFKIIYSSCGKQHKFLRSKFIQTQNSYKDYKKKEKQQRKKIYKQITLNQTEGFSWLFQWDSIYIYMNFFVNMVDKDQNSILYKTTYKDSNCNLLWGWKGWFISYVDLGNRRIY